MRKKQNPSNIKKEKCLIPPRIPTDALPDLVLNQSESDITKISRYVEDQSKGERVIHAEKVMSEHVLGSKYECWDVRTNKTRLWVITSPTNLYSQSLFPSLDYTLSFHIGVTARVMAQHTPNVEPLEQIMMADAWRRWEQAGQLLNEAEEAEDFQSVGMRCRECLIAMVRTLADPTMVPEGTETPKRADVIAWCDLISKYVACGASSERVRGYLKATSRSGWELVNWLTHATGATLADGILAHNVTEHILSIFGTAFFRHKKGIPDRCEACGSYQIGLWADNQIGSMKPRCRACGWMKEDP